MQNDFNNWQRDLNAQAHPDTQPPMTYQPPMKWHYFLISFPLWAGAILNFLTGLILQTGSAYGVVIPPTAFIDKLYGTGLIGLGVFQILTRFQLARFKARGPVMLLICYAAGIALQVLYALLTLASGASVTDLVQLIDPISIGISVTMILAHKSYYDKRAELFIH